MLYLRFGEHEGGGHLEAFGSRQVLVEFELVLQLQQLLAGERRPGPPALAQQVGLRLSCVCAVAYTNTIVTLCNGTKYHESYVLLLYHQNIFAGKIFLFLFFLNTGNSFSSQNFKVAQIKCT